jgi:hypothetical protein
MVTAMVVDDGDELPPVPGVSTLPVPTGSPPFRHAPAKVADTRMNLDIHMDNETVR